MRSGKLKRGVLCRERKSWYDHGAYSVTTGAWIGRQDRNWGQCEFSVADAIKSDTDVF